MPLQLERKIVIYFLWNRKSKFPVEIRGEELVFSAKVQAWRFGLRFLVDVDGVEVILERDDAGEFRALLPDGFVGKLPEKEIVESIIMTL